MASTDEGRERLRAYEESLTRTMAEHVERDAERSDQQGPRDETKKGFLERSNVEHATDPSPPTSTPVGGARERRNEPHPRDADIPQPEENEPARVTGPSGEEAA